MINYGVHNVIPGAYSETVIQRNTHEERMTEKLQIDKNNFYHFSNLQRKQRSKQKKTHSKQIENKK